MEKMSNCSCPQLFTFESLTGYVMQQRDQTKIEAIAEATKVERKANEGLTLSQ